MTNQHWYQITETMLLQQLQVDQKTGLTEKEVIRRQKEVGPNRLTEGKKVSPFLLFLNQFQDFMVLVLLGATLISGLLGEYTDAIAIIAIVVINAVLGFVQEYRAEKSLRALKELTAPTAKVIRDGEEQVIPAVNLVPGDIILLESGDRVPADARLFKAHGLYVEESALTGES
ncbi:MAG: HAD-IC family P-type ATPase, partial [Bacilli bacterium]